MQNYAATRSMSAARRPLHMYASNFSPEATNIELQRLAESYAYNGMLPRSPMSSLNQKLFTDIVSFWI